MGDDYDGKVISQFVDKVLDFGGGDGIEGGAGFIHEEDVGLEGYGPGDAESLLLPAGECQCALVELGSDFFPEGGLAEGHLDEFAHVAGVAVDSGAPGDVVEDRFWEGVGFLENHADVPPEVDGISIGGVEVLSSVYGVSVEGDAGHEVVHAIEGTEKGAFATAGRADDGGYLAFVDVHSHFAYGGEVAVVDGEVVDADYGVGCRLAFSGRRGGAFCCGHSDCCARVYQSSHALFLCCQVRNPTAIAFKNRRMLSRMMIPAAAR